MKRYLIIIPLSISIVFSCTLWEGKKLDFYSRKGGFDTKRIPLIKPYEITSNVSNSWMIYFYNNTKTAIPDRQMVDGFAIIDSLIIIKGTGEYMLDGETMHPYYSVIIPKNKIERWFVEEAEYNKFIDSLGVKSIEFHNPEFTSKEWEKSENEVLPWKKIDSVYERK